MVRHGGHGVALLPHSHIRFVLPIVDAFPFAEPMKNCTDAVHIGAADALVLETQRIAGNFANGDAVASFHVLVMASSHASVAAQTRSRNRSPCWQTGRKINLTHVHARRLGRVG
jgi:hypothetical protein